MDWAKTSWDEQHLLLETTHYILGIEGVQRLMTGTMTDEDLDEFPAKERGLYEKAKA